MMLRSVALLFALSLVGASPAAADAGGAANLFYERSLMSAAGARCKLFDPSVAAALAASSRQARGAALRAGADAEALDGLEARARDRAGVAACQSPDLGVAAGRVRAAFAGYSKLNTLNFPGGLAVWRADRGMTAAVGTSWRLAQAAHGPSGSAVFGLASTDGGPETLIGVAGWPAALAASGARLVMRDTSKAPQPYLDRRRKLLVAQVPPRPVARVFLASAREAAAASLLPPGATTGAAFRFSTAAAAALARLDPREAVLLEVVYPARDGERVEAIPVEVGDFAAGIAFLSARR